MRITFRIIVLSLVATSGFAQQATSTGNQVQAAAEVTAPVVASMSAQAVAKARDVVAVNPKDAGAYATLGAALCRQADETSSSALYGESDEAISHALKISPDNFDAKKAQVCVELGRHEYALARENARTLNKRIPDDIMVYGLLVDANAALGNYPEAEDAAQWMLRLRPGNTPAFLRAAELREVFGEQQGALQLLQVVLDASSPADASGRAAIFTRMARIDLETGDVTSGETAAEAALALQPGNPSALLVMAQLRLLQGRSSDAVPLIRQAYNSVSQSQTLYALGIALDHAGMQNEAKRIYSQFEEKAGAEISQPDNANRELVFYYADHANAPAKALAVAEREIAIRHDVHTLDAYAWALCKSGRYADAKKQMDLALKVGIREADIFYHAGEIELRLGNSLEASRLFKNAVELKSLHSQEATIALARLFPKLTSSN